MHDSHNTGPEARALGNIVISLYNTAVNDGYRWPQAAHLDWYKPARAKHHAAGGAERLWLLYVAQQGGMHRKAKPLKGFGEAGVVEIVSDYRGATYRCIYTVRIAGSVYVLHVFQKKSKKGRETPKAEIELIRRRLREAERIAKGGQP